MSGTDTPTEIVLSERGPLVSEKLGLEGGWACQVDDSEDVYLALFADLSTWSSRVCWTGHGWTSVNDSLSSPEISLRRSISFLRAPSAARWASPARFDVGGCDAKGKVGQCEVISGHDG
jgi:hypothetical protein